MDFKIKKLVKNSDVVPFMNSIEKTIENIVINRSCY